MAGQMVTMLQLAEDVVAYIQRMPANKYGSKKFEETKQLPKRATTVFPYRTGNMRQNGTSAVGVDENISEICIGGNKAPYAIYTQLPWISPRWHGRKNPNEGWLENLAQKIIVPYIRQNYKLGVKK